MEFQLKMPSTSHKYENLWNLDLSSSSFPWNMWQVGRKRLKTWRKQTQETKWTAPRNRKGVGGCMVAHFAPKVVTWWGGTEEGAGRVVRSFEVEGQAEVGHKTEAALVPCLDPVETNIMSRRHLSEKLTVLRGVRRGMFWCIQIYTSDFFSSI